MVTYGNNLYNRQKDKTMMGQRKWVGPQVGPQMGPQVGPQVGPHLTR